MSSLNLIEVVEQLTIADIAELFARKLCLEVQSVAHHIIETNDDAETNEYQRRILETSEAMIEEAQSVAFECYFHYYDFSEMVDGALVRIAEEYVR